jgi:hypothetical protein
MAVYWVGYDLLNKATFGDYEKLIAELEKFKAQRILYSDWVLRHTATSEALRDHFRQFIHSADRILVAEITANWASLNILADINKI